MTIPAIAASWILKFLGALLGPTTTDFTSTSVGGVHGAQRCGVSRTAGRSGARGTSRPIMPGSMEFVFASSPLKISKQECGMELQLTLNALSHSVVTIPTQAKDGRAFCS